MKAIYRGHEIEVTREKCLGGYPMLYWGIMRLSDDFGCDSGFADSGDTVRDMMKYLKKQVDAELAEDDPWMEKEEAGDNGG